VHDGWLSEEDSAERPSTRVVAEKSRTIVSRNDSPDVPFSVSINPYKGCEHGCVYCFARPSHAYLGLSPGLDFETRIVSKPDAAELLIRELSRPSYQPEPLALGANTDPYQPAERRLEITRSVLEVLCQHHHPVGIVTKSDLVLRDLDLLSDMASRGLANVFVSVTSLNAELAGRMEPRAPRPDRRLYAIEQLSRAGVPVGVLASPMIPGLNDHELERILEASRRAGARVAGTILIRLPLELKELFEQWLRCHYPLKADKVLRLIREARGGQLYDSSFGTRMRGTGPYAEMLRSRFERARRRYGYDKGRMELDCSRFRRPARGERPRDRRQLPLF
jgi:DNA repair photolyase